MKRFFFLVPPIMALLFGCLNPAQPGGQDPVYDLFVDNRTGNDANAGSASQPFKTVTKALSVALPNQLIKVLPGVYDAGTGEVFPLTVPSGVGLIGNEAANGADTVIRGGADLGGVSVCVRTGQFVKLAGLSITNDVLPASGQVYGIEIDQPYVTVQNCAVVDCAATVSGGNAGIIVSRTGSNARIIGVHFVDNMQIGLEFNFTTGVESVLACEFRGNLTGVLCRETADVDLGGGGTSPGGSTFACNTLYDLEVEVSSGPVTISAQNDYWDHAPPSGNDIGNAFLAATVDTTGAMVAANNCP